MPTCVFILCRFTLRVDQVLFRTFDTRIYHSFSSSPPSLVKETSGWEAPYDRIRRVCGSYSLQTHPNYTEDRVQHLQQRDDLTPLTDPAWIANILSKLPVEATQKGGAGTRWKGLGTKVEIIELASSVQRAQSRKTTSDVS